MMRPRPMKRLELTVLERDVDRVIEMLGKRSVMQLAEPEAASGAAASDDDVRAAEDGLRAARDAAAYLGIPAPEEPGPDARLPSAEDAAELAALSGRAFELRDREAAAGAERAKVAATLSEAKAFANLKAPFKDLEQLSYLTLRIGSLDPRRKNALDAALADRAIVLSLGEGEKVVAAAARKGRFALDAELAKAGFQPMTVPPDFAGVPDELLVGLAARLAAVDADAAELAAAKAAMAGEAGPALQRLVEAYEMAAVVAALKRRLVATRSAYRLSGWVAAARVRPLVTELTRATDGRIAVLSYDPEEVPSIAAGAEKVPVSLDHGYFVGGFERLVLSYGAPLYGTIDPTPFVAGSFILLFGLMFGDVGQGLVLLLLGLAVERSRSGFLSRFRRFGAALTAVGLASMAVGFLDGEFFASEGLLIRPTRWVTGALFGRSVDRVLNLMPERDNLGRLFLFFGFTLGVGALINSIGLIINMLNRCSLKQWDKALFSKTGAAGALFFWYALSFGVRLALGAAPAWFDFLGFGLPLLALIAGPPLWRLGTGHRPVFEAGGLVFAVESFVELLEVMSSYVSNTVSFLRVGAFALSHAVLSFAVFTISDLVAKAPFGGLFAFSVMVVGNVIIILLEGLIVAIQVTRLQYYEFFSKFFTETGVEFRPFRFRREVDR